MFGIFGIGDNEALIKENQKLRRELMEYRHQELARNLLAPYQNQIRSLHGGLHGGLLGALGPLRKES